MTDPAATAGEHLEPYLREHEQKTLLRFITCGSVDDGKSTLLGRLLFESRAVFDDQLAALAAESRTSGTRQGELDFALLVDGLSAEREQGITIDVAYRYFSTAKRKFIVADTPGHEQYTRNTVTAASTADAAVVLVDARKGVLTQTRRHTYLVALLGVRHVILAVNKMDLVGYSPDVFRRIAGEYAEFAGRVGLGEIIAIPTVAVDGSNVVHASAALPWYEGPTVLSSLEQVLIGDSGDQRPFRMPVQFAMRPSAAFRGVSGLIVSGRVEVGSEVSVMPSGVRTTVAQVLIGDRDVSGAAAGQSVTLRLADDVDVSRGAVVVDAAAKPQVADQFEATLIWMDHAPMLRARQYLLKIGTQTVSASVAPLKYKINVDTLEHVASNTLECNEIGVCGLSLSEPVVFEPYRESRDLGGCILIDRLTHATVGAGLLHFPLRRAQNISWQALDVTKSARAGLKGQQACMVWLTGLSGAGKSTIANLVEKKLHAMHRHTYVLDGDNVRHGLSRDLGFTDADRVENIRRVAEVARLMCDAGLIVLVSLISPFRAERRMARDLMPPGEFIEVFVDTPLAVAEQRDPKGLYRKARRGELKNFTGVDAPYEPPENPALRIDTTVTSAEEAAEAIVTYLGRAGFFTIADPRV